MAPETVAGPLRVVGLCPDGGMDEALGEGLSLHQQLLGPRDLQASKWGGKPRLHALHPGTHHLHLLVLRGRGPQRVCVKVVDGEDDAGARRVHAREAAARGTWSGSGE